MDEPEFAACPQRVVMWRDPHQQAESTYRFLPCKGEATTSFAEWICTRRTDDPHLISQTASVTWPGIFLPNLVLRWDFDAFRELFATGPIAHLNRSAPAPTEWTDDARAAFEEAYADDLRIWDAAAT